MARAPADTTPGSGLKRGGGMNQEIGTNMKGEEGMNKGGTGGIMR